MATFLFDEIIFGPVRSRRLGASLGINLLPVNRKFCNFNCIYCECGWSPESLQESRLPNRREIREHLETRLRQIKEEGSPLDRITFAGNGEPTIHPEFPGIMQDTVEVRNRIFPGVRIAVLSNASRLDRPGIFEALNLADLNILKLDSAHDETVRLINQPPAGYRVDKVVEGMMRYRGHFILQTLFLTGERDGVPVDNTTGREVDDWLDIVARVKPEEVMIYTIERDTPIRTLRKAEPAVLDAIAAKVRQLGIPAQVSY